MKKLIDPETLKKEAREIISDDNFTNITILKMFDGLIDGAVKIDAYTEAEVQEIRETAKKEFTTGSETSDGEWEFTTHYARRYRVCPICHAEKEDDHSAGWFFCWHCGAKLEKGE